MPTYGNIQANSTNGITKPANVAQNTVANPTNWYGLDGKNQSSGEQIQNFYYAAEGLKGSTSKKTFSQFASAKAMARNSGKEFKISVYYNIYDRMPWTDGTWNTQGNKEFSDSFLKYGYLASRDIATVNETLYGTNGKGVIQQNNNGVRLLEGQLSGNKISPRFSTLTAKIETFGRTIDYTDDLELFGDKGMIAWYHYQCGAAQAQDREDCIQLDLLATPNVLYSGVATSKATLGAGIGEGAKDTITGRNALEDSYAINYSLIQKIKDKLRRYRVPPHKSIIAGSVKVGTKPIAPSYVAIVGPEIAHNIENVYRFITSANIKYALIPVEQYANPSERMDGEIGAINGIRFVYSEQMMVDRASGALVKTATDDGKGDAEYTGSLIYSENKTGEKRFDVFPMLIVGEDGFATINLTGGNNVQFFQKRPGQVDSVDNYGAYGFYSYKFRYAGIILRPERVLRVNVLAFNS